MANRPQASLHLEQAQEDMKKKKKKKKKEEEEEDSCSGALESNVLDLESKFWGLVSKILRWRSRGLQSTDGKRRIFDGDQGFFFLLSLGIEDSSIGTHGVSLCKCLDWYWSFFDPRLRSLEVSVIEGSLMKNQGVYKVPTMDRIEDCDAMVVKGVCKVLMVSIECSLVGIKYWLTCGFDNVFAASGNV
jgi:hypothetical protein